jgi:hypothetical protein
MEKRRTPRINLSWMANLEVDGINYSCNLKNLNNGGALLSLKEKSTMKLSKDSVGSEALLTIKYNSKSDRSFEGRIVRVAVNNRAHAVAIEFVFTH